MPRGSKSSYSSKQKRMASRIESSAKRHGRSTKTAERIAWATVNKRTGGAKGKRKSTRARKSGGTRKRATSRKRS
ncbi:MAG TPA: hypothetical protein VHD62_08450 [Opitutaceae bacterium]|nr:hypothetical protein [Opitutaceae bacterium]